MFSETQEGPPAVSRLSSDDLDHLLDDNNKVILQNIADDLRAQLPLDAMLPSETTAHLKVWSNQITTVLEFKDLELSISDGQCLTSQMQQCARPTVHVDSFLYSDEQVDSLCEEGAMSRTYCLRCGSTQTAPLGGTPAAEMVQVSGVWLSEVVTAIFFSLQTSSLTPSQRQNFSSCSRTSFRT